MSMLTKMKKKKTFVEIEKSRILKNGKKWSIDMVDRYLSTKSALVRFMVSVKTCFTDDGHQCHGISSADTFRQSQKPGIVPFWPFLPNGGPVTLPEITSTF